PINLFDPTGRSCVAANGVWVDNGDGSGCTDAGRDVTTNTGVAFSNVCNPLEQLYSHGCDRPLEPAAQQIMGQTGALLRSVSVGVFGYGGTTTFHAGALEVEQLAVVNYDSNDGVSYGTINEVGFR